MYFFVTTETGSDVRVILYLIGSALIVVTTLSVLLLYVLKLFLVVRGNFLFADQRSFEDVQNDPLLPICSKYTVLAMMSVLTEFCFWSVGRLSARSSLWFFFLYVNATANVLCFALGLSTANGCYGRMC